MKRLAVALILLGCGLCCSAETHRLDGLQGYSFRPPTNTVIVWAATNELPRDVWVYKVVPQEFSMAVVSNVMALCEFQFSNLHKTIDPDIEDKKLITFTDKKERWTRYLEIAPTLGWIDYYAQSDPKAPTNGVPSPKTSELEIIIGRMHFATGIPA